MRRRVFTDRQGADWTVVDIPREASTGLHSESWLCFTKNDGSRVRIPQAQVSGDWRRFRRAELVGLLDTALRTADGSA